MQNINLENMGLREFSPEKQKETAGGILICCTTEFTFSKDLFTKFEEYLDTRWLEWNKVIFF